MSRKILFLTETDFGIKPLYFHHDGSDLIFSSEINAIFAHSDCRSLIPKWC